MTLVNELYEIEKGFWLKGKQFFLKYVDDQCLLAFPQAGEMHGVHSREDIAATANSDNRWRNLTINQRHLLHASDDFAIISYKAEVLRVDGEPYAAIVSSVYVRRPLGWKLAFHQHSPI